MEYYGQNGTPTIYVGRIYRLYNENDKDRLKDLLKRKYKLEVWEKLHKRMYSNGSMITYNYLSKLKSEVENERQ